MLAVLPLSSSRCPCYLKSQASVEENASYGTLNSVALGMININREENQITFVTKDNSPQMFLPLQKNPDGKNDA